MLIVEDEPAIAELIAVNLRHNGFRPIWAMDSTSAQCELDAVLPDVILLDWMLPGESGLTLAKRWRANPRTKGVPIIMLTARGDEVDRVAGLDAGADDGKFPQVKPGCSDEDSLYFCSSSDPRVPSNCKDLGTIYLNKHTAVKYKVWYSPKGCFEEKDSSYKLVPELEQYFDKVRKQ